MALTTPVGGREVAAVRAGLEPVCVRLILIAGRNIILRVVVVVAIDTGCIRAVPCALDVRAGIKRIAVYCR
ncbi:MAG: hypothetical protein KGZ93_04190 [Actinobacteria bacterium]|nr:hypothetical protein [Actinomycetota bacterium]